MIHMQDQELGDSDGADLETVTKQQKKKPTKGGNEVLI